MQDLLPTTILCGHTAGILALVACGVDKINGVSGQNSVNSIIDGDFSELNSFGIILSICADGWICVWDCLTRQCKQRRKLPQSLGIPTGMTLLNGAKHYVVIVCDGHNAALSGSIGEDTDGKTGKLINDARLISWERNGNIVGESEIFLIIVDTSTLGVVQVVHFGLPNILQVKAITAVHEGEYQHKVILSDASGHVHVWRITLEGEEESKPVADGQGDNFCTSFLEDNPELGGAISVCFSPDGSYVLLVFGRKWVLKSTNDQSVLHQSFKNEGTYGDPDWSGGLFLLGNHMNSCPFLVWDTHGGATFYGVQTTEAVAVEEICYISSFQRDSGCFSCFKYQQLSNLLLCIASGHSFPPTPDVQIKLWLLHGGCAFSSELKFAEHRDNGFLFKCLNPRLYGHGNLRSQWTNSVSTFFSNQMLEESLDCRLLEVANPEGEWVTASMVLFSKSLIPLALVLGFNNGAIKVIGFWTSLQGGEKDFLVKPGYEGSFLSLKKHSVSIICLAEKNMFTSAGSAHKYLLSGCMDGLTCIWNLNTGGQLVKTLHHHVSPVCQILLPPYGTYTPWSNCFMSVGEDGCVALISLETLQVERMFVGHPSRPKEIVWDGVKGYIYCICSSIQESSGRTDLLFIWDMKSGALERVLQGPAAHDMYAWQMKRCTVADALFEVQNSSNSSFLQGGLDPLLTGSEIKVYNLSSYRRKMDGDIFRDSTFTQTDEEKLPRKTTGESSSSRMLESLEKLSSRLSQALNQGMKQSPSISKYSDSQTSLDSSNRNLFHKQPPVKGASPFPGVAALQFDLFTLMAPDLGRRGRTEKGSEQLKVQANKMVEPPSKGDIILINEPLMLKTTQSEHESSLGSTEGCLLRTTIAFLHLWGADAELDKCLQEEWQIVRPLSFCTTAGLAGDKGATTLLFPSQNSMFQMWTQFAEFCAVRSLTLVATSLRMATLCRHSNANSTLAAFYTRGLAEKYPKVKAPSLEIYACFWQDPSEHVRMAARSLFHCAVCRAIPPVLRAKGSPGASPNGHVEHGNIITADSLLRLEQKLVTEGAHKKPKWPDSISSSTEIIEWLESYEDQQWTEVIEGSSQDARAARIIVASALAVWYPGLVKPELAPSVAPYLLRLVKAMVDQHSAVAAELLGDGMESVWKHLITDEIPHLISDVFLLIQCLSGKGAVKSNVMSNRAAAMTLRESLTGTLLPALAMADVASFLNIVQSQILSGTSSVHLITLMTMIRIVRGASRLVIFHLSQAMAIILQIMNVDRQCHQTAMGAIKEMARVYPMVGFHQGSGKVAVGDAAGDVHSLAIHIYDLNSSSKLRVLDASGPPGHPALLVSDPDYALDTGGISALAFAEDGEGVVAFSQHGLIIRWWSLSSVWWEKLSRVNTPVQCNKLVLVPPWSGFSPKSSRSSIMATISKSSSEAHFPTFESRWHQKEETVLRTESRSIDLSFKLEWRAEKTIALIHNGQELGLFQL
ncbi:hypothetical protein KP509_15G063500 [Ceratopteris richardii]|uniref:Uncharacterized protein n=1 Tax=Ceratopteris richardii TaxID=49495 RepID=A0A8T2T6F5_CERRI|nr:hypothetical protein KP509_15G063500 [Ceratopteris richardii]